MCERARWQQLGANSLLDTLVFGRRSGEHAAELAKSKPHGSVDDSAAEGQKASIQRLLDNEKNGDMFGQIRQDMGGAMNEHLAVYRKPVWHGVGAGHGQTASRTLPVGLRAGQGTDLEYQLGLHIGARLHARLC